MSVFAKTEYGLRERHPGELTSAVWVAFSAQTRMSGVDHTEDDGGVRSVRKGAASAVMTWVRDHRGHPSQDVGPLVDDEPQILRALRINLNARQYQVEIAANGADALHSASVHHPDLVVLDLGLPDMDGVEVIRKLRTWTPVPRSAGTSSMSWTAPCAAPTAPTAPRT
jgi:hypothetical protein